jgi:hypothetical protein
MNMFRYSSLSAAIALIGITACNYTVGECWPVGEGGASAAAVTAGGGVVIPTGPSGAGGFGNQPPKRQEIKCNSDEDEDAADGNAQDGDAQNGDAQNGDAEGGTPGSASSPTGLPIGSFSASEFHFLMIIPDDGKGDGGGWQEAKVVLKFKRSVGASYETFTCPQMTIGTPLRNKAQGKITATMASETSADIATYVASVIDQVPQGIFCAKLKDGMDKMMRQAISGSRVTQP